MTEPPRARTSSSTPASVTRERARRRHRARGPDRLVHRALRLGEVDDRGRARAAARVVAACPRTCSTATTSATASTATSASTPPSRTENVRRAGEVALLFADAGVVAIVPLISPYRRRPRPRARAATRSSGLRFVEVFVDTPIELCEQRDPKGLYAKARAGEITDFTGIDDPYEAPLDPDVVLTPGPTPAEAAAIVAELLGL